MKNDQVLLACDVVDSTALTERLGDAAAAQLWAKHDALARALLSSWHGREVDKTDGLFALFDDAQQALGFAEAYRAALHGLEPPLECRVALHRGEMWLRPTAAADVAKGAKPLEVDGIAKPLVARACAIARSGQTLLTHPAAAALPGRQLRSLGHWRLKGLSEPVAMLELADRALGPPTDGEKAWRVTLVGDRWLPVRDMQHSLPAERDSFVGRRQALAALDDAFAHGARLVSILGMGGSGKTRLAQHFGWDVLGRDSGGVWFCDLSQAASADEVVRAVASGVHCPLGAGDPMDQVTRSIARRGPTLIILDNVEQVIRHSLVTLCPWLDRAPQARFLVTTREVLGVPGEEVLDLPPLDCRDAEELFLQRARSVCRDFAPDPGERDAVARLAAALDGLPLAIELAAARVRVMPPVMLLQRMSERFDLLRARSGRPDRHATLRATLDWSWDLLTWCERATLAQLCVFRGSFSLPAAEAVVVLPDEQSCAGALASLVDKSLVRALDGQRLRLLESVREYASIRLRDDRPGAAAAEMLQARHWHYFASLDDLGAIQHRCADLDNLIEACRAACAAGDGAASTRCLVNTWAALRLVGPYRIGIALASQVAATARLCQEDQALVQWAWGTAQDLLGEVDTAREHFERGFEAIRAEEASEASVRLLLGRGSQLTLEADMAGAQDLIERALSHSAALGHDWLRANALNALGRLMDHQAKTAEARTFYEQALDLARTIGDRQMEGGLLGNLGGLHYDLGEAEQARRHYEQALAVAEEVGDLRWLGNTCSNLGLLLLEQGSYDEARRRLDQALALARGAGNVRLEYTADCNLGILLAAQGQVVEAEQQFRGAVEGAARASDRRSEAQFCGFHAVALARLGIHAEASATLDRAENLLIDLRDPLTSALLACDRSEVAMLGGRAAEAGQALLRAKDLSLGLGCGPESELGRRLRVVAKLLDSHAPQNSAASPSWH